MVRAFAGLLAALFLAAGSPAGDPAWDKFASKDGRFEATFPGPPKKIELKVDGETVVKNSRFEAKHGGVDFSVGYIAYAPKFAEKLDALDAADFAKRQRENTASRTAGKVLEQEDITLGHEKRPGYELLIEVSPTIFIRQRAVYANGRFYQMMVVGGKREAVTGADADKFLGSFRLTE